MGMYSYIGDNDVEIKDMAGLKKFFERIKIEYEKCKSKYGVPKFRNTEIDKMYYGRYYYIIGLGEQGAGDPNCVVINEDDKTLDFQGTDGWKIIQYWYEEFVCFLRDVALFVEGYVTWRYETDEETAKVTFEDGECSIEIGVMQFQEYKPEDVGLGDLGEMDPELQRLKVAKKL